MAWSDITHMNYTGLHISWENVDFRPKLVFYETLCPGVTTLVEPHICHTFMLIDLAVNSKTFIKTFLHLSKL